MVSRSYGFVGGRSVYGYVKALKLAGVEGSIDETWTDIGELYRYILVKKGTAIQELEKIVIIDDGMTSNDSITQTETNKLVIDLVSLQKAIHKHAYGLFLVVYTNSTYLYTALNAFFEMNPNERYDGLDIILNKDDEYVLQNVAGVFDMTYRSLDDDEIKTDFMNTEEVQAEIQNKATIESLKVQYKIYKELLEDIEDDLYNKMTIVLDELEGHIGSEEVDKYVEGIAEEDEKARSGKQVKKSRDRLHLGRWNHEEDDYEEYEEDEEDEYEEDIDDLISELY